VKLPPHRSLRRLARTLRSRSGVVCAVGVLAAACSDGTTASKHTSGAPEDLPLRLPAYKVPTDPSLPARTFRMGFSAIPPRLIDSQSLLTTIDAWVPRADAAILPNDVPWAALLAGVTPASLIQEHIVPLVDYYRAMGLSPVVVTIDPLNSGARDKEAWDLLARGRSITEPAIQALYKAYVTEVARLTKPDYLLLALEVNLVRAVAPATVYGALVTMTNAGAAGIRAAGLTTRLGVSVEVETAWSLLPRTTLQATPVFQGIATERGNFTFLQFLGLSAYPHMGGFTSPSQVPSDYYARLAGAPALPLMVTEGGWASDTGSFWTSNPAVQADWITRQAALVDAAQAIALFQLNATDIDLASYPVGPGVDLSPHAALGVVDVELRPKPSLAAWDKVFARPSR
jgi:hypothetical protein